MSTPDLATLLTRFFLQHLAAERNVSPHTAAAYRDTLKLFIQFAAHVRQCAVDHLQLAQLTADLVLQFLEHLETARQNSVRTRNARLAALHAFYRYVMEREPSVATLCQRVLLIPFKKTQHPVLGSLTEPELAHLLQQVDRTHQDGERDYLFLALLYDTAARVQELLDLTPAHFRLARPSCVRLLGKGRRERLCPLLPQTARLVSQFLHRDGRTSDDTRALLRNRQGQKLTRHGARYLLHKYLARAQTSMPSLRRRGISPHTLRHTKAMHLLQAGVPLVTIKDFLGHADLKSTEVYVQIDLDMKRAALQTACTASRPTRRQRRLPADLIAWLEAL